MPITFGSVGDIISISLIIKDIIQALDESRGSAAEYQEVIRELWGLDRVLLEVEKLSRTHEQTIELHALCLTARRITDACRKCVQEFLDKCRKYDPSLGEGKKRNVVRDVSLKLRWRLTLSHELDKFRAEINSHCSSLNMLLAAANVTISSINHKELENLQAAAEEQTLTAFETQKSLLGNIQERLQENTQVMVSMDRNVTSIARALKLDWLRNWGSEVKEHLGKLFILNVDIYRTVIRIQAALSYVDRGPQLEAFILEDAIGRTAPVTLQFITSWEALDGVLETRFRNLQGHAKIVSKEFVLQERITRRDVSRDGPWEGAILPGQKIEMSIVFTDARNDKQTSCPGCQQACEIHSESGIQCPSCGMWFGRIIELYDNEPANPPTSLSQRSSKQGLDTVKDAVTRRQRKASGAVSFGTPAFGDIVFGPEPPAKLGKSLEKKRRFQDEITEDDKVSRFKRVRIISRQKLVKKSILRPSGFATARQKIEVEEQMALASLKEKERMLGGSDPHTITAMITLADIYRNQRKFGTAEELLQRAMNAQKEPCQSTFEVVRKALQALITVTIDQKKLELAGNLCQRLSEMTSVYFGAEHAETATCQNQLEYVRQLQRRLLGLDKVYNNRCSASLLYKPPNTDAGSRRTIEAKATGSIDEASSLSKQYESFLEPSLVDIPNVPIPTTEMTNFAIAGCDVSSNIGVLAGPISADHSSYISVTTSILGHEVENGRRYHHYKAGKYYMPNDDEEQERMDLQHNAVFLLLSNRLFLVPIKEPKSILDQGTGTGIWAIDVADEYGDSVVIGTDLSPIQPDRIPPNLQFEIDDVNESWVREHGSFDLVHCSLGNGFSERDWGSFLAESYNCLMPGGWVEIKDIDYIAMSSDDSLPQDSAIVRWHTLLQEGASLAGNLNLRFDPAELERSMKKLGFTNVEVLSFTIPIGRWPKDPRMKEIGMWWRQVLLDGLEAYSLAIFTRLLKWPRPRLESLLKEVRKEVRNRSYHWYWPFYVVYGQKPVS